MKKATLENRLIISPGDGLVIAPSAALPISFTLELSKPMPLEILTLFNPTISLSCEGKKISRDALERIKIRTEKEKIAFEFDYIPFSDADKTIDLSSPERKKMDIDLIEQTAYQLIHGKRTLSSIVKTIFDYVYHLPVSGTTGYPYQSDQVLRAGIAKKCVDKSHLFVDLCLAVDIPARCEYGVRAPDYSYHAWVSYFDGRNIQLIDPSLGYTAKDFPRSNYFCTTSAFLRLPLGEEGHWKIHWNHKNVRTIPYPTHFFTLFTEIFKETKSRIVPV